MCWLYPRLFFKNTLQYLKSGRREYLPPTEEPADSTDSGRTRNLEEAIARNTEISVAQQSTTAQNTPPQPVEKLLNRPPIQQKIVLTNVLIEGNTAISDAQFSSISKPYLNRPLRFSDLEQLRVDITRAYTDRGYISSGAVLPDQKVTDGQLIYRIVEGQLDEIEVSGTGRLNPAYVESRVRVGAGEPFNSEKLQESFQLLLDDPLIERMDGQLLPVPKTGLTKLKLKVTPSPAWLLNLTGDNHGSPSVGAEQLALSGSYLNPTGIGDRELPRAIRNCPSTLALQTVR